MSETTTSRDAPRRIEILGKQTDEVVNVAVDFHLKFEEEMWKKNPSARISNNGGSISPSFHNENHPQATLAALDVILSNRLDDPFQLDNEIKKWNKDNPQVTFKEAEIALRIAFACHDLGNLTETAELANEKLKFADKYLREGAEERSVQIAQMLIDDLIKPITDEDRKRLDKIKPLVSHLIRQTVFNFEGIDSDEPFWYLVQIVDQIAPYYFSSVPPAQAIAGLLNEGRVRRDPAPQDLSSWLSFPVARLEKLVPDEGKRKKIIKTFEQSQFSSRKEEELKKLAENGHLTKPFDYENAILTLYKIGQASSVQTYSKA